MIETRHLKNFVIFIQIILSFVLSRKSNVVILGSIFVNLFVSLDKFFFFKMPETSFYSLPFGKLHKKPKQCRLKNFPTSYVGSFFRNLADNVDNYLGPDFYEGIANNVNVPSENIQKYMLATSDSAKSLQNNINHYMARDRINNASFR